MNPGKILENSSLEDQQIGKKCVYYVNDFTVGVSGGLCVLLRCALNPMGSG